MIGPADNQIRRQRASCIWSSVQPGRALAAMSSKKSRNSSPGIDHDIADIGALTMIAEARRSSLGQ
jgi:hypothetical protein